MSPRAVIYRLWSGAIPNSVCDAVVDEFSDEGLYPSHVQRVTGEGAVDPAVRRADHTFVDPSHWVGAFVSHYATEANLVWNLDLTGLGTLSFIRYDEGGHFQWHVDALTYDQSQYRFPGELERKLSVTVNLSDPAEYDGGDLEFMNSVGQLVSQGETRTQGSVIVFPSTVCHRVTPITRGTRFVVVGWMVGPPLR